MPPGGLLTAGECFTIIALAPGAQVVEGCWPGQVWDGHAARTPFTAMVTFLIVVLVLLCLLCANLVSNLRALDRPVKQHCAFPSPPPLVSIMVPARNEEDVIGACVESLLAQDYPSLEVIVYDDGSTDKTSQVVAAIAERDSRVHLMRGEGPPPGWAGKPNACYQMARMAKGDYLLFVDADTTHRPSMLRTVVSLAVDSAIDLISGFPQEIVKSLPEKAAVPLIFFYLLSALPLTVPMPKNHPSRAFTSGQFLFFSREIYWGFGGHEAVKSRMMEDFQLGLETRRLAGRRLSANLATVTCCRMYDDARSIWEGCRKWGYGFSSLWPKATLFLEVGTLVLYLGPFVGLIVALAVTGFAVPFAWLSLAQVALILGAAAFHCRATRIPVATVLLFPIGTVIVVGAFLAGSLSRAEGRSTLWKGRRYDLSSGKG